MIATQIVETKLRYLQVHCVIWGVQVARGGQEGLANQVLGLPVEGKGTEGENRRQEDLPLSVHVVSFHKSQLYFIVDSCNMGALLYLLSFDSSCSIQTWKALRSSLTLEVKIQFSHDTQYKALMSEEELNT